MNYDNVINNPKISLPLRNLLKEAKKYNLNLFLLQDFNGINCTFNKSKETEDLIEQLDPEFVKETISTLTFYFNLDCLRDLFTTNILSKEKYQNAKWCIFQQLEKYSINNDKAMKVVFKLLSPDIKHDLTFKVLLKEFTKNIQEQVIKYNAFNLQKSSNSFVIIKSLNLSETKDKLYNEVFFPNKK